MIGSDQADQLRTKSQRFAIRILKLFVSLPKTPGTLAIETPLLGAATTLALNCRALVRTCSADDSYRSEATRNADDCIFWLELLAALGAETDTPIPALIEEAAEILALLSICSTPHLATAAAAPASHTSQAIVPEQQPPFSPTPSPMPKDFRGLRVVSFESRMAAEMTRLIERNAGLPLVVPALREIPIPLQDNGAVFRFGVKLILQQVDILILMTGVGARTLFDILLTRYPLTDLIEALRKTIIVARGPKPIAALKAIGAEANITVPEPNTWQDVIATLDYYRPVKGLRIGVQEYGTSNPDMIDDLIQRGAEVFPIPVYRWALPEDTGPLKSAIREILDGRIHAMLVTNAAQIDHVIQLVEEGGETDLFRKACKNLVLASIGPTASERLKHYDLPVDFEPSHPKMGVLVKELSERIHALRHSKQH